MVEEAKKEDVKVEVTAEAVDQGVSGGDGDNIDLGEDFGEMTVDEALGKLECTKEGLTEEEAKNRLEKFGLNELPHEEVNKCLMFFGFMWNPLSWVMEMAAVVAIVLSNGPQPWLYQPNFTGGALPPLPGVSETEGTGPDYPDFIGIVLLLFVNSAIGFYEENSAGNAVAALMEGLAPECSVKRDGEWKTIDAKHLVPGDIITIKLGDIIPADAKIVEGEQMKVDQSGLTGESLPVSKNVGDEVFSSCVVKQGENEAVVFGTGLNTFFGRAAALINEAEEHGHLQQVLGAIGNFCMIYIGIWIVIMVIVMYAQWGFYYRAGINMVLVVLIGGIPIAMPTVLSVTMALGVSDLSKEHAIVTRITAVEEMAGVDILCSDKTGTLTLNELKVDFENVLVMPPFEDKEMYLFAALAAKREGSPDAIDLCVTQTIKDDPIFERIQKYNCTRFMPFDPVGKRTEAALVDKESGEKMWVSKGAPQVMIDMAHNADEIRPGVEEKIDDFAGRGLRAIGVAVKKGEEDSNWEFVGLISLNDPPRHDTAETVKRAIMMGVEVKMVTGDQVAIGKETGRRIGMGSNFHNAKIVRQEFVDGIPIGQIIEEADGFGEVFPEDKFRVVDILRKLDSGNGPYGGNHMVGMTGDGVNDAPALKCSDVGIAVDGATDAARAAADMVLTTPGLSVIITAIIGSRKIFQRMKNYAMYACTTTIRIVTTFGVLVCAWQFQFPPFMVLIIAFLNDGTILTISRDRAEPSPTPDAWRLNELFSMGFVLGLWLTLSTVVFWIVIIYTNFFDQWTGNFPAVKADNICNFGKQVANPCDNLVVYETDNDCLCAYAATSGFNQVGSRTNAIIYLQVSITGQLVIFCTRARLFFFQSRPGVALVLAFFCAQIVASLIAAFANWPFTAMRPAGGAWVLIVWIWSIIWFLPLDIFKLAVYAVLYGNPWKAAMAHRAAAKQAFAHPGAASSKASAGDARMSKKQRQSRARASQKKIQQRASKRGKA